MSTAARSTAAGGAASMSVSALVEQVPLDRFDRRRFDWLVPAVAGTASLECVAPSRSGLGATLHRERVARLIEGCDRPRRAGPRSRGC
ncbi:MAG: hypothetical protein DI564_00160 [Rhodanobacter denitrificans]|uniref:Uncharacterized protein n=1 Tax=Rhodanobacter denitrificans TaxID=666685 RepID=A0A2W5MII0_9GAMM|nr:MAG: hypothetical protein DI564_00160 [Rhodanobacter denitrificans]